jgi:hypothetical protein
MWVQAPVEAPAQPDRSSATRSIDNSLRGIHPLVIHAFGHQNKHRTNATFSILFAAGRIDAAFRYSFVHEGVRAARSKTDNAPIKRESRL